MKIKVIPTTQRELVALSLVVKPVQPKPSQPVRRDDWTR